MKKVFAIISLTAFLGLSGCDFFRKVAGRPTSDEIRAERERLEARSDSLLVANAFARALQNGQADSIVRASQSSGSHTVDLQTADSLRAAADLRSLGVKISSVFSFGRPLSPSLLRFSIIAGVFRKPEVADTYFKDMKSKGFAPFYIMFEGNVRAICLGTSDNLSEVSATVGKALAAKACPSNVWIFAREQAQ